LRKYLIILLLLAFLTSCGGNNMENPNPSPPPTAADTHSPQQDIPDSSNSPETSGIPETPQTPVTVSPPEDLTADETPVQETSPTPDTTGYAAYDGPIEHLFFHTLIAYPEKAFSAPADVKGNDDWMITVPEYNKIIQSLYEKDYIIVNMNDCWSEYTDANGNQRMKQNTLMLPPGKKPIIISFDDISYYVYMVNEGAYPEKLIVGEDGEIWSYGKNPQGELVISQDNDAIPILNNFIKEHPDFSLNGAKGMLCMTGYDGIFGYRTGQESKGMTEEQAQRRMEERSRVRPVVETLKATGWYFANHTWGHINLAGKSLSAVQADYQRWVEDVEELVGPTQILVYPHGARLDGQDVYSTGEALKFYVEQGYRMFASVGNKQFVVLKTDICAVMSDRMHADGTTLRNSRDSYLKFYDAVEVWDDRRIINDTMTRSW